MTNVYLRSVRLAWPAIALAVGTFVVFMNKAFNLDDVVFLAMADHMLEDPLHPASVFISLNGRPPDWISNGMWSGPVEPALLMPSMAAGGAEWLAHLAMTLVFIFGIVASAAFALRMKLSEDGARWTALLVGTSTAVLALAHTNMPDVPTMAFGVFGAERLLAFRNEGGWWRAVMAVLGLALCVLSRQHGVLLVACLVPVMFETWPSSLKVFKDTLFSRAFLKTVGVMVAAAAFVIGLYAVMHENPDTSGLAKTPIKIADTNMWRANLANIPAQWLLTFPLVLAWICLYRLQLLKRWWCYVGAAIGVYLAVQVHVYTRRPDWLPWQAPLTALGAAVLADVIASAIRRRDLVELGLTLWLFIMFPMAVYTHLPAKYFVPSAPAMAVLIMRHAERGALTSRTPLAVLCVLNAVVGVLVIRADAVHGEVGRKGGEIVAKYVKAGERVWYDGAWAFQHYAHYAGARPAHTGDGDKPQKGDIVVVGLEGYVIAQWPNKKLIERIEFNEPGGRTLQRPAGFFSNVHWGPLPWVWSKRPHDPVEVYRIE